MTPAHRPRVLLVGQMPPTKGGLTTFMLNLMASYLQQRFEITAFSTTRPPKKNVIKNWGYGAVLRGGVRRILIGIALTVFRLCVYPFHLIFRRIDIAQVHANDYHVYWEAVAYVQLSRLVGRRVILRIGGSFDLFHAGSPPAIQRLISRTLEYPDLIIAQSQFARAYIEKAGRTKDIIVLPNWTGEPVRAVERHETEHPVCVFIASNEAIRKGVEEVIDAMRRLDASGSPARFHLLAMVPQLIDRVAKLGLRQTVKMEGPVDHKYVLDVMRGADIFLLPSHGEGFPNSLIEAMTAGMASVVTPVSAVPEIVAGGSALVVDVGNGAMLAEAIDRLARDPALRREMGLKAQDAVRRRYTPEVVLGTLEDGYNRLLSRPARLATDQPTQARG